MSPLITFRDDASAPLRCIEPQPAVSHWRHATQLDYFGTYNKHSALQQPWAGGSCWLRSLARRLKASDEGWVDAPCAQRGMLVSLEKRSHHAAARRVNLRIPRRPDAPAGWQALLTAEDLRVLRKREPLVQDLIHVLQCLFPGQFVLEHADGRALTATPPPEWMRKNERRIKEIWGIPGYDRLKNAAAFPAYAV